jgi:heme/copper-type cytochrome/quinol oxidase subunit 2
MGKANPLTLVKIPVNKVDNLVEDSLFLFKFRYNDSNAKLSSKNNLKVPYFAFKQQRYKSRKAIPMMSKQYVDELGSDKVVKNNFTLNNQYSITTDSVENPTRYYRMFRKNRIRSENMPVVVSKRLLRVKRTLVLPTHINITAVTNSYDVVHSWFIPGLGLKMDCVPGRSTHHTFYVDNAGFYYGQCAEICGRYHHHMPIRVCALPFEHFLVW